MKIVYTDEHRRHNPQYELYDGVKVAYAESALRADSIIEALENDGTHEIISPVVYGLRHILAVHQRGYVDFIKQRSSLLLDDGILYPSYFISDTYAPLTAGTYTAARKAVDSSLTGAEMLINGEKVVYSLCRPPGHHAGHHSMGGYCYFNNAAIAANYLSSHGRVAILDIDFHHGNGSQDVFYDRSDVLYVSLHSYPQVRYPYVSGFSREKGSGGGLGYNYNYPLQLGTGNAVYLRQLNQALEVVGGFAPDYLVVSAGFDTFAEDPIGGFGLTADVYYEIGYQIAQLKIPSLLIQEGGYNLEYLGNMVSNFLRGFKS